MTLRPMRMRTEGEAQVRRALEAHIKAVGLREAARQWKVAPAALSQVLAGTRPVSPRLARAVGYEKVIVYRRSGARKEA